MSCHSFKISFCLSCPVLSCPILFLSFSFVFNCSNCSCYNNTLIEKYFFGPGWKFWSKLQGKVQPHPGSGIRILPWEAASSRSKPHKRHTFEFGCSYRTVQSSGLKSQYLIWIVPLCITNCHWSKERGNFPLCPSVWSEWISPRSNSAQPLKSDQQFRVPS